MQDTFNLSRFVEAQRPVFSQVMDELRAGRKTSHWMWFVFPQLRGLGRSDMAGHCSCLGNRREC
ncbi:NTP pyrophosphohydrolase [Pseudomonas synxantha]|uniref:NTP pyrophosphohydrolase n=1 Tax=Pseudomonas synxantha TaxID=47883 RepID=A0A3G7U7K8_9PSED|nr:NTP pyrophosphohydrolase [Pseudomonas synxantha]